ncbi:hypothetical protein C8Q74DRAFT_544575 [Fomes fomentarius]|nr:hypothetical protein C8Q74DRAFT_544575 [Fomes fomentarius]
MAHANLSPSFPTASSSSLRPVSCLSRDDYTKATPRRTTQLFVSPSTGQPSYEHFSALRSTHDAQADISSMFEPVCSASENCSFVPEDVECEECAQVCEDASCAVELTPQCTDQCVVVACSDAHHASSPCDGPIGTSQCGKECPGEFDCSELDKFLLCCIDHPFDQHGDYRSYTPGGGDYAFMADPSIDSYLGGCSQTHGQQLRDTLAFPPLESATSTPQLGSASSFEPSPPPPSFAHSQMGNPLSSPSPSTIPSPALQAQPAAVLQCKWSGCYATFSTMSDLVGHVNLQHLRVPGVSTSSFSDSNQSFVPPQNQQGYTVEGIAENTLACLWGDCQLYPSSQSLPGPSSGDPFDVLGLLTSHLLHDHLGVSARASTLHQHHSHGASAHDHTNLAAQPLLLTPSLSSSFVSADHTSDGSPPTPIPEHDCSSAWSHICRWTGCGQNFNDCNALTEHITCAHIGSGRAHYDCFWEGCSRNGDNGFASKQKISRHMQSHTGHRPFQCSVCSQNFSEAATLAQHMRRHTQEKPYVCDFPGCGKAFAIAGALTIHKRTHSGSKPFKCTYCERAFSESSNLSKHVSNLESDAYAASYSTPISIPQLRTHTGARPYPCTEPGCSKTFARPDQLARHMNVHKRKAAEKAEAAVVAVK